VARYAAFNNVFLWTLANEYETHPDGRYRLDVPGDPDWAKATARLIKSFDPVRHLVTVHPVVSASTRGASPRDVFHPPWRIGEFFGPSDASDVLSQQTAAAYAAEWDARQQRWIRSCAAEPPGSWSSVQWDEALGCWTGDVPGVNRSIAADRIHRKPVLNTENGYEHLSGSPTGKRQVHHTDKVRRTAWRIVCAGGYCAAGFAGTTGQGDPWERIDPPNRYPFRVEDAGAAGQLAILFDTFAPLPFWEMTPRPDAATNAVVLGSPGKAWVIYAPRGGSLAVELPETNTVFTARWVNPRREQATTPHRITVNHRLDQTAPDREDWVLVLTRAKE
jgi:hypothetical protein